MPLKAARSHGLCARFRQFLLSGLPLTGAARNSLFPWRWFVGFSAVQGAFSLTSSAWHAAAALMSVPVVGTSANHSLFPQPSLRLSAYLIAQGLQLFLLPWSVDVSGAAFVLPAQNNEQLIPHESLHGRHCSPSSSPRAFLGRTSVFPTLSVFVQSKLGSESAGKYFYNRTKHKPSWCRWRMLAPLPMCTYRAEATMCCVNWV